jgi:hypothetical protein
MHRLRRTVAAAPFIVLSAMGAGCTETFRGAPPVVGSEGPTIAPAPGVTGQVNLFFDSAKAAYSSPDDPTAAQRMVVNGFGLIYSNCDEYFRDAGRTQRIIIFSRDLLGTIGTLATGVVAIAHASKDATAIAALITATGYAVMDNITKDYLFSSDNIDQVRELTLRALAAHQAAFQAGKSFNYPAALIYLEDNQNYCSLSKIAALVKDAIKNGQVVQVAGQPGNLPGPTKPPEAPKTGGAPAGAPPPPPAPPPPLPLTGLPPAAGTFQHVTIGIKPLQSQ